jgi:ABC-type transporter Mla subunit MlaD
MAEITIRVSDRMLRIVAISGMVIAAVALLWSSGVFVPKYRLRVYVPQASGLGVHTEVRINGVLVGSVNAIKLAGESGSPERAVELDLRVDKRYQDAIRSDSVATSAPDGILGARYLSIRRGYKGIVLAPDGEIPFVAAQEMSFTDILKSVERTVNCSQLEKASLENKNQVLPSTPSKPHP